MEPPVTIPSYLANTGLPHSVCYTIHVLSGANQLEALRLAQLYSANINTISRAEVEKAWREKQSQAALLARARELNKAEHRRAAKLQLVRNTLSLEELLA